MLIFKISGLCFILLASTCFGFCNSANLKNRNLKLKEICISIETAGRIINSGRVELDFLINHSFKPQVLTYKNEKFNINNNYLLKEDIELFNEFLKDLGMQDLKSEQERISLYKSLFIKQQLKAEENAERLCKLYNTVGFLTGLSICIFLI